MSVGSQDKIKCLIVHEGMKYALYLTAEGDGANQASYGSLLNAIQSNAMLASLYDSLANSRCQIRDVQTQEVLSNESKINHLCRLETIAKFDAPPTAQSLGRTLLNARLSDAAHSPDIIKASSSSFENTQGGACAPSHPSQDVSAKESDSIADNANGVPCPQYRLSDFILSSHAPAKKDPLNHVNHLLSPHAPVKKALSESAIKSERFVGNEFEKALETKDIPFRQVLVPTYWMQPSSLRTRNAQLLQYLANHKQQFSISGMSPGEIWSKVSADMNKIVGSNALMPEGWRKLFERLYRFYQLCVSNTSDEKEMYILWPTGVFIHQNLHDEDFLSKLGIVSDGHSNLLSVENRAANLAKKLSFKAAPTDGPTQIPSSMPESNDSKSLSDFYRDLEANEPGPLIDLLSASPMAQCSSQQSAQKISGKRNLSPSSSSDGLRTPKVEQQSLEDPNSEIYSEMEKLSINPGDFTYEKALSFWRPSSMISVKNEGHVYKVNVSVDAAKAQRIVEIVVNFRKKIHLEAEFRPPQKIWEELTKYTKLGIGSKECRQILHKVLTFYVAVNMKASNTAEAMNKLWVKSGLSIIAYKNIHKHLISGQLLKGLGFEEEFIIILTRSFDKLEQPKVSASSKLFRELERRISLERASNISRSRSSSSAGPSLVNHLQRSVSRQSSCSTSSSYQGPQEPGHHQSSAEYQFEGSTSVLDQSSHDQGGLELQDLMNFWLTQTSHHAYGARKILKHIKDSKQQILTESMTKSSTKLWEGISRSIKCGVLPYICKNLFNKALALYVAILSSVNSKIDVNKLWPKEILHDTFKMITDHLIDERLLRALALNTKVLNKLQAVVPRLYTLGFRDPVASPLNFAPIATSAHLNNGTLTFPASVSALGALKATAVSHQSQLFQGAAAQADISQQPTIPNIKLEKELESLIKTYENRGDYEKKTATKILNRVMSSKAQILAKSDGQTPEALWEEVSAALKRSLSGPECQTMFTSMLLLFIEINRHSPSEDVAEYFWRKCISHPPNSYKWIKKHFASDVKFLTALGMDPEIINSMKISSSELAKRAFNNTVVKKCVSSEQNTGSQINPLPVTVGASFDQATGGYQSPLICKLPIPSTSAASLSKIKSTSLTSLKSHSTKFYINSSQQTNLDPTLIKRPDPIPSSTLRMLLPSEVLLATKDDALRLEVQKFLSQSEDLLILDMKLIDFLASKRDHYMATGTRGDVIWTHCTTHVREATSYSKKTKKKCNCKDNFRQLLLLYVQVIKHSSNYDEIPLLWPYFGQKICHSLTQPQYLITLGYKSELILAVANEELMLLRRTLNVTQ